MLTHVGHDNRVLWRLFVHRAKHRLRREALVSRRAHGKLQGLERTKPLFPLFCFKWLRVQLFEQTRQNLFYVAEHMVRRANVLVDLRGIDVDLNDLRVLAELRRVAGHAVVKPAAERDKQLALRDGGVRRARAMHADESHKTFMCARKRANAHQRRADRSLQAIRQRQQFFRRAAFEHAAAREQKHLVMRANHTCQFRDRLLRLLAQRRWFFPFQRLRFVVRRFRGHVFRNVHEHRPRATALCDDKRLAEDSGELVNVLNDVIVLRNRRRDAGDVRLLKAVLADQVHVNVARDEHDGNAVEVGRGNAGHEVGRPRAGGCDADADLAARAGVAIRRVRRALLMRG